MFPLALDWPPDATCLSAEQNLTAVANDIYSRVCRIDFTAPGVCVLNLGRELDSFAFRRHMVELKQALDAIHQSRTGQSLVYLSAARFDQQETTKPHRDGGPDECFLMLGYEPSEIRAELEISDYARCAFDLGLTPREFLAKHNPRIAAERERLVPYTIRLPCFSPADYQIVFINNSCAPFSTERPAWQGVLHTATILNGDESQRRIINSTLIAPVGSNGETGLPDEAIEDFVHNSRVQRRGYDKLHLEDDA